MTFLESTHPPYTRLTIEPPVQRWNRNLSHSLRLCAFLQTAVTFEYEQQVHEVTVVSEYKKQDEAT